MERPAGLQLHGEVLVVGRLDRLRDVVGRLGRLGVVVDELGEDSVDDVATTEDGSHTYYVDMLTKYRKQRAATDAAGVLREGK